VIGRSGRRQSVSDYDTVTWIGARPPLLHHANARQIATTDQLSAMADHVEFIIGRAYPPCFKFRARREFFTDKSLYDVRVTMFFDHCMIIILQSDFGARISALRGASKRILLFFSGVDGAATSRIPSRVQG
jgi:hypothetical protein